MQKMKQMTERQKTAAINKMLREQQEILGAPRRTASKKTKLRFRMRNMRYLQLHPERTMHKAVLDEQTREWFPPEILAIKDPVVREKKMAAYTELRHQLLLQRKYKHSCQSEMSILKLARNLGLMPKGTCRNDRETKEWEHRQLLHKKARSEMKWKMQALARSKKNRRPKPNYAQMLLGANYKPGKGRKPKCAKTVVIRNGEKLQVA